MKKYPLILLAAASFLTASCGKKAGSSTNHDASEAIPVQLMPLEKSGKGNVISASGTFTTDDETFLAFKTGGIISNIPVKEGDKIVKGQLLASLNTTEIAAMEQQSRLAAEKATRDFERVQNLFRDSVATLEQLQNARTGKEITEQQFRAAQFNLAFSEIRATGDGVVLRKFANPGQVVGPGTPVLQTSSKGKSDWLLKVAVSDREWSAVTLNDTAIINTDTYSGKALKGIVTAKSENADPMTGSFAIEIKLLNGKQLNVATGMFGKAIIYSKITQPGWVIPYEALLDGNGNRGFVFVTNDGKKAIKVPVIISAIENDSVVITEGLDSYAYIITSGSAYLTDQSEIKSQTK